MTKQHTFETAFSRLEKILERMNSDGVTLDESLALFEEANGIITFCNERLAQAEKKVEILLKNRNGELTLGEDGKPERAPFDPEGRS